jgi:ribosomal protein S1
MSSRNTAAGGRFNSQQGDHSNQFRQGSGLGLRPVSGEIISQDDKSITVKLQDGSSRIVILSDQTEINKTSEGSKEDLKTGERITTFGTENSDGSVTAQNVQLNPQIRVFNGSTPSGSPR